MVVEARRIQRQLIGVLLSFAVVGSACGGQAPAPASPSTTTATTAANAPTVTLSPTTLAFTNTTLSSAQAVTLTNTGTATLNIASLAVSGNFVESHDCGSSVDVGASCTISVTFAPLAATSGASGGIIAITDDASTSPQSVSLSGPVVTAATGVLSPKLLTFGSQPVGTTSSVQAVTLTNPINGAATVALGVFSIGTDGDFGIAQNGCGKRVVAGDSCLIGVVFTPTASGPRTGLLTVTDNASVGLSIISLSGVGQ